MGLLFLYKIYISYEQTPTYTLENFRQERVKWLQVSVASIRVSSLDETYDQGKYF